MWVVKLISKALFRGFLKGSKSFLSQASSLGAGNFMLKLSDLLSSAYGVVLFD